MTSEDNETLAFEDIDVAELEAHEEYKFSAQFGYTPEDLTHHRADYSLEERRALLCDPRNASPEVQRTIANIIREQENSRAHDQAYQEQHRNFITHANKRLQRLELEEALRGERAGYENLTTICMTQGALETAYKYAQRIIEATGRTNEIYFHLIGNEDDSVVRGVAVPEQNVSGGECVPTGNAQLALRERTVGIGHSHGSLSAYHSSTDHHRLAYVPFTYGVAHTVSVQGLLVNPRDLEVWVCPSVIVNARNENALAVSAEYTDPVTGELQIHIAEAPYGGRREGYRDLAERVKHVFTSNVHLELLSDLSIVPSDEEIDSVIWERVRPEKGFTKAFEVHMQQVSVEQSMLEEILETETQEDDNVHMLTEREYAMILRKIETLQRKYVSLQDKYTALRSRRFWRR